MGISSLDLSEFAARLPLYFVTYFAVATFSARS
jgi:hypothetical protein